jgi:hypothetical protein
MLRLKYGTPQSTKVGNMLSPGAVISCGNGTRPLELRIDHASFDFGT